MDMLHEQQDLQAPSFRAQYQAGGNEADQKKKKKKKKMLARQHQGMDGAASRQDPETSRRQRRLEKDHQNICRWGGTGNRERGGGREILTKEGRSF